jgi:hypothetical protein
MTVHKNITDLVAEFDASLLDFKIDPNIFNFGEFELDPNLFKCDFDVSVFDFDFDPSVFDCDFDVSVFDFDFDPSVFDCDFDVSLLDFDFDPNLLGGDFDLSALDFDASDLALIEPKLCTDLVPKPTRKIPVIHKTLT